MEYAGKEFCIDGERRTHAQIIRMAEDWCVVFKRSKITKLKTIRHAARILQRRGIDIKEI